MPQDLDSAADYLSLYMVARAGYSVEGAHAFWQRLATQYPASVLNGYTANHPPSPIASRDRQNRRRNPQAGGHRPLVP
jgi:predicted Zn-dependent protease